MPTESAAHRLIPHLRKVALARGHDTPDADLFAAFVATQDEAAFATLVRRHGPTVLGVCRRVVGDAHLAEDAFQATFLVLARRAGTVRPRELGAWLYGVAYRTALKARGNAARRKAREHQVEVMPHPTVSSGSPADTWADLQPVLDEELARLPDKLRGPLVLCDLGGRPQRAVARDLAIPAATLANRLAAGRKLLAKRLTERGVVLSAGAVAAALGWHAATHAVSPRLSAATVKLVCVPAVPPAGLPPQIVELSEGVMRMFLVTKLKAVAAGGLTVVLALAGLGVVSQSDLRANPDGASPPARPAVKDRAPVPDDLKFLRQISLDLRGTIPSTVESHYFLADRDAHKRGKLIEWMLPDHATRPVSAMCSSCHQGLTDPGPGDRPVYGRFHGSGVNSDSGDTGRLADIERYYKATGQPQAAEFYRALEKTRSRQAAPPQTDEEAVRLRYLQAVIGLQAAQEKDPDKAASPPKVTKVLGLDPKTVQVPPPLKLPSKTTAVSPPALNVDPPKASNTVDEYVRRQVAQYRVVKTAETDAEFLRRLSLDLRGVPPSKVEENYFLADTDPRKREKLVELFAPAAKPAKTGDKLFDEFLADPEIAKRYAEWRTAKLEKEKAEAAKLAERRAVLERVARQNEQMAEMTKLYQRREVLKVQAADPLAALVRDLSIAQRTDEQILDAVFLATVARFPTDAERKLVLEVVRGQSDKKAAWDSVAQALSGTPEAKAHAEALTKRGAKK